LDKLQLEVRPIFSCKIPIFECSDVAVKNWKAIVNQQAPIQDLTAARQGLLVKEAMP
jgi:hypothetical protein